MVEQFLGHCQGEVPATGLYLEPRLAQTEGTSHLHPPPRKKTSSATLSILRSPIVMVKCPLQVSILSQINLVHIDHPIFLAIHLYYPFYVFSSGLEIREYGRRDPSRCSSGTLYPQTLAPTSPTSGNRSVGILRSRTHATETAFFVFCLLISSQKPCMYCCLAPMSHALPYHNEHKIPAPNRRFWSLGFVSDPVFGLLQCWQQSLTFCSNAHGQTEIRCVQLTNDIQCRILGSRSGSYEKSCLLGYNSSTVCTFYTTQRPGMARQPQFTVTLHTYSI
jgi:hypothetical protein